MSVHRFRRRIGDTTGARQILIPRIVGAGQRYPAKSDHAVRQIGGLTMGTSWSVKLVAARRMPLGEIKLGVQDQLDRVVAQMSTWLGSSTISHYNRAAAGSWHPIEPEFFAVLTAALELARSTGGAYDPTVGEMVGMWGFGPGEFNGARPSSQQIAASVSRSGWTRVSVDSGGRRIFQPGGVELDLSSIAKGSGVDQVARFLEREGFGDFLVEVGGELRGAGCKPDGTPWWVVLELPYEATSSPAQVSEALLALHGISVATSGDYRRRVVIGNDVFSHTLDPLQGAPVAGPLASVSVIASDCMMADALATALFVLGPVAGKDYAVRHQIAARFVMRTDAGFHQAMTPAMVAMLY
ncbi:MAG: FAD:protein FMN transferase [Hyphomicrobiaceae bacterium]